MPPKTVPLHPPLPRSHYFLTISRGSSMRTFAIRTGRAHVCAALFAVMVLGLASESFYLGFHDDVVSAMMVRQTRMQDGYEERIAALRLDLEQQASRHIADQAKVDTKVSDLFSREAKLELRAEIVASLAGTTDAVRNHDIASSAGAGPRASLKRPPAAHDLAPSRPVDLPEDLLGFAPLAPAVPALTATKPRPEPDPASETPGALPTGRLSRLDDNRALPLRDRLALASASLDRLERKQVGTLARIGAAARGTAAHLRGLIEEAGLSPDRFAVKAEPMGGPFVPLPERDPAFDRVVLDLRQAVAAATRLKEAVLHAPFAAPLSGSAEVTSPFGARTDPFLGRPALHTGVDLREDYGVDVRSTAPGRVTAAGPAGGYGNMVEIDHGSGLVTRYAHLSEILVAEGQSVPVNAILGRVGSTGRATGPHLHYEIRIDGEPVDPMRFLNAGAKLDRATLL